MASTHGLALPSRIGISSPDTSAKTLSIPNPWRAESRCSTVATRVPDTLRVVPRAVSLTRFARAGMSTCGVTSTRRKMIPWLAGAGQRVTWTSCPVCGPLPERAIELVRVVCFSIYNNYLPHVYGYKFIILHFIYSGGLIFETPRGSHLFDTEREQHACRSGNGGILPKVATFLAQSCA